MDAECKLTVETGYSHTEPTKPIAHITQMQQCALHTETHWQPVTLAGTLHCMFVHTAGVLKYDLSLAKHLVCISNIRFDLPFACQTTCQFCMCNCMLSASHSMVQNAYRQ